MPFDFRYAQITDGGGVVFAELRGPENFICSCREFTTENTPCVRPVHVDLHGEWQDVSESYCVKSCVRSESKQVANVEQVQCVS